MKRFRPAASPHLVRASGDRWLFGYADVVTLLLACFVCLYASTLAPSIDVEAADGPTGAQEGMQPAPRLPPVVADAPSPPDAAAPSAASLEAEVRALLGTTQTPLAVELSSSDRGLVISVPEAGSFPAGQADLSAAARLVMLTLAADLRDRPNAIRVEGHTDDVPIRTPRYRSNWELSTARATSVVQFLIEEGKLSPERLVATGYSQYRPKVTNDSPESRARNRRVDLVVLEPQAAALEFGLAGVLGLQQ